VKSLAIVRYVTLGAGIAIVAFLIASILVLLVIGVGPVLSHNSLTVFQAKRAAMFVLLAMSLAAAAIAQHRSPMVTSSSSAFLRNSKDIHNLLLFASVPTLLC